MAEPKLEAEGEASSANSYAILAKLATGGMAELFLARTVSTAGVERYVVLKRVLPERVKDSNFVAMFLDEARLAAQLQHPNIAQVFDTGRFGDSYFFSMEYVHGETVREIIHRAKLSGQSIPIGCALTIIANAAAGLHHAHERLGLDGKPLKIVHRDVSPSNLMVTYEGNVKVVDFGVAKATRRSAETQTGTVKGKIGYLSPEQCRGRASDRRSDLFSLGIVLWELLVGERMYKRENDYDTMEAIVMDTIIPAAKLRSEVPPELDAVIAKMLAKAPGDRYQSADEVHDALEQAADAAGIRMSSAALKRFVVELFGKRPEPWIEMQTRDAAQEVVTVSAAVIGGLDTVLTELADSQLSNLPDLTNTPSAPRRTPTPLAFDSQPDPDDANPSGDQRRMLAPSHARRDRDSPGATLHVRSTSKRSLWLATGVSLVAGLVVAWKLFGHRDAAGADVRDPATNVADNRADHNPPDNATTTADKATDRTTPDKATPDKATPDQATPDKSTPANVRNSDNGSVSDGRSSDNHRDDAAKTANAGKPVGKGADKLADKRSATKATDPRHRSASEDIAANMRAGKYADVVVACLVTPKALAQNLVSCTLAACQTHDANARVWFGNLPPKARDSVASQCASAGTEVAPPKAPKVDDTKPTKPCTDPMECWK